MRAEISVLTSRVAALQAEIERRDLEPSAITAVNAAVASISTRLSLLEMEIAGDAGQAEPAAASASMSIDECGSYLDSCAKYASEASRMRITGRLPFGSDHYKII
jgi:uncharacterized small protein (DUF1192 family)